MRIIFSRKGFDSASGGGPSPIVEGRPLTLPIPSGGHSRTRYDDLGLGEHVAHASKGKLSGEDFCHHDPMFLPDGTCLFGQTGAAQTHLANRGVREGDVFLFFGLFRDSRGGDPHHRFFGFLEIEHITDLASCNDMERERLLAHDHPHAIGMHGRNDVIYAGRGHQARNASDELRLTAPGASPSLWRRPDWLKRGGLSYHDRLDRWRHGGLLQSVARGQEFVADIGRRQAPRRWLTNILTHMTVESSDFYN
ncbi:hypothetical protein [Erythrobacter sp. HKB08]|uniref:Nmad3 family putative nucleotide modification protein n=1 Tax=Erythrobacter sp. HKB08 TaxID=2502843 RepID=UPI0010093180|nr:hypothetical protein [Erythrobacter sp. HKB08]